MGAHQMRSSFFHVLTWTTRLTPFACNIAAILWDSGHEDCQIDSQRSGTSPTHAARLAPKLRGDVAASPFLSLSNDWQKSF